MSWERCFGLYLHLEGGFVLTNPSEGPTFAGVLKPYYDAWCDKRGRTPVWPPTQEGVASYVYDNFFNPFHCAAFPDDVDAIAFQMCVNLPSEKARQLLQVAVGVEPDGEIGPVTLAAIRNWTAKELGGRILLLQTMHYVDVRPPTDPDFAGLLNRVAKVRAWLSKD